MVPDTDRFATGAAERASRGAFLVSRNSWWRLENGGAVGNMVGDDHLTAQLEGTRILCLRERWTFHPMAGGRLQVTAEVVSDPQPPFGLTGIVTSSTAQTLLETLDNFAVRIRSTPSRPSATLDALPSLSIPLPDVDASFVTLWHERDALVTRHERYAARPLGAALAVGLLHAEEVVTVNGEEVVGAEGETRWGCDIAA